MKQITHSKLMTMTECGDAKIISYSLNDIPDGHVIILETYDLEGRAKRQEVKVSASKYTAANTPVLATIKRIYNHKIYKHALRLYNEEGERATLDYLQQFTTIDIKLELGAW